MDLTQKSTFPNECGGEMRATDKVIQKNQNTAKQKWKSDIQLQNGSQKTISISRHNISDQKWENHFPEGIFPWNLAHNCGVIKQNQSEVGQIQFSFF